MFSVKLKVRIDLWAIAKAVLLACLILAS